MNVLQHFNKYNSGFASQEGETYIKCPSLLLELVKVLGVASGVTTDVLVEILFDPNISAALLQLLCDLSSQNSGRFSGFALKVA